MAQPPQLHSRRACTLAWMAQPPQQGRRRVGQGGCFISGCAESKQLRWVSGTHRGATHGRSPRAFGARARRATALDAVRPTSTGHPRTQAGPETQRRARREASRAARTRGGAPIGPDLGVTPFITSVSREFAPASMRGWCWP